MMTFSNDSLSPSLFALNDKQKEEKGDGKYRNIALFSFFLLFAEKLYFTFSVLIS